eukprot:6623545-Pyramimonas_sp.AAC.1
MSTLAGKLSYSLAPLKERQFARPGLQPRISNINIKLNNLGHSSAPFVRWRFGVRIELGRGTC